MFLNNYKDTTCGVTNSSYSTCLKSEPRDQYRGPQEALTYLYILIVSWSKDVWEILHVTT